MAWLNRSSWPNLQDYRVQLRNYPCPSPAYQLCGSNPRQLLSLEQRMLQVRGRRLRRLLSRRRRVRPSRRHRQMIEALFGLTPQH
jgi:hypothetical protein